MPDHPSTAPMAWQRSVGQRIAAALASAGVAHAPAADRPAGPAGPPASRWRVARAQASGPAPAIPALARAQAADPAGRARAQALMGRCLQHYREQIRPDDSEDDAGAALACFLAACVQARVGEAVTLPRWQAVLDWLEAWAADGLDWGAAPVAEQRDFFERMACMAVAIGEWSVLASRQGEAAMRSAQALARNSLRAQLDLDLEALATVLQRLPGAAANPSWGDAELPKAPTTREPGRRL